jgi:hypothetical protein
MRHGKIGNISSMFYANVNFLDVYIEYVDCSQKIEIRVVVTDDVNPMVGCSPVMMSGEFTAELLEDFGIDITDKSKITQDPERFLINVIKITSDLNFWNVKLKSFLASQPTRKKTKYNTMPLNYPSSYNGAPSNYQEKRYFYDEPSMSGDKEKIKSLSAQIEAKDNKIKDLEDELQELKEEIRMIKAINQEC